MRTRRPVVLLVEDNGTLRRTLRRHLQQRLPIDLLEASSAAEAGSLARRETPDIILLDLSLPDESGLGLVARLRSDQRNTRVIAMTGYRERQFNDEVLRAGAWACIPKDSLGSQLEPLLRRALRSLDGGPLLGVQQGVWDGWTILSRAMYWLDLNGPWAGRPRTRVLYLANVVMLAFVIALRHQSFGI